MTPSAKILLKYAREIVQMNEHAHKEITQLEREFYGDLGMGCSLTIGEYYLPAFLKRFKEAYPLIQIQVSIANSHSVVSQVKDQLIDVGLIETPIEDDQLRMEPFLQDELVLIAPPGYFMTDNKLSLKQIQQTPIIFREEGSGTRAVVNYYMEQAGLTEDDLHVVMELGSTEAIKAVVESGLGVSFISKNAIQKEKELGLLQAYRVSGLEMKRNFYITYREKHVLKSATELFLETLRSIAKEEVIID